MIINTSLIRNVTDWYSWFLNQPVFQENKICNFKIHLFSILNNEQMLVFFQTRLGTILIWQTFSGMLKADLNLSEISVAIFTLGRLRISLS